MSSEQHKHTNKLAGSKSPYLLQHAHNPVDWYPWGDEALDKARKEDKPIFLSIGYSTCHWCHVMEHESFEDSTVAALLNEHYVSIKVDREERPDLDNLYMTAVQGITGRGGWPMTVVLTTDLEPFFAGTYFPPEDRGGMPGLKRILEQLADAWKNDRAKVTQSSAQVADFLRRQAEQSAAAAAGGALTAAALDSAYAGLSNSFDATLGGFGPAPKFPTPHRMSFLFRYGARTGVADANRMALASLDAMAAGGLRDHLGGGFHRYSTDAAWLAPHFEKMLYDQAGLALAFCDAYQVTGDPAYGAVVRDVLDYVLNYLTDGSGGFYSAEDADSEGEEGTFYVWSAAEIDSVLGPERSEAFRAAYDVTARGNWEGKNILNRSSVLLDGPSGSESALAEVLAPEFAADRAKLLAVRDRRPRPHRDEKIITSWNGFMIEAFARGGRALGEPRYIAAAESSARFVTGNLRKDGRLLRHYRGGAADVKGYLDDYAFLGRGFLALYEATFDPAWLKEALDTARNMETLFGEPAGGFSFSGRDAEKLLAPVVDVYDGAMPSGNSAAAVFLLRLGHLTADTALEERGRRVLNAYSGMAERSPTGFLEMLSALDFSVGPQTEVVIAGTAGDDDVRAMLRSLNDRYLPNMVLAFRPEADAAAITGMIGYLAEQKAIGGKATAYVCRGYACRLPVHTADALSKELDRP